MQTLRQSLFVLILFHLAGCASSLQTQALLTQPPDGIESLHTISGVPFYPQEDYQCGPAALATLLNFQRINVSPEALVPLVYIPGKQGSFQVELVAAGRSLGALPYILQPEFSVLLREVNAGNPVLVLQNLGLSVFPQWHFAVVKGYDLENERVVLNSGTIEDYTVSMTTFERTWRRGNYWAFTLSEPGNIPVTAEADRYFLTLNDFETISTDADAVSRAYTAGLDRWPGNHNLAMGYGNFLYTHNRLTDSAAVFQQLIARDNSYAPAYNNLAHVLFELGDYAEAMENAETAVALSGNQDSPYTGTYQMILERLQTP